jgi:hypothetical protein
MTDVVMFLDALSPRELTGILSDIEQGKMDSGTPRVTPRVMSSIYTGLPPSENGMMAVSRYGGSDASRPVKSTFIDKLTREGGSVLSMGMPFCIPFQSSNSESILNGQAIQGEEHTVPQNAERLVGTSAPVSDMISDHPDRVYASFRDNTASYFNRFKEAIREVNPDCAFLGYRLIDSYCHFNHTESRGGATYREHLIDDVASLVERVYNQIDGDILFFSDHGQTEMTDVFRVNRWLKDKGYLSYKVDYDFIDTFESVMGGESHPAAERVENQITFNSPGVTIDHENSDIICADAFDSCLTLLTDREDFDHVSFRDDLLSTGMYRSVDYRWEEYDEDDDLYETVPHVLPDRDEGVFVSGNIHKNPIGMGYYRSGVHDYTACFGSTAELDVPKGRGRGGMVTPEQMYSVITDFVGLEVTQSPVSVDGFKRYTDREMSLIRKEVSEVL